MEWFEIVGLLGVALSILAYARLQCHRDFAKTFSYSALNLIGAGLQAVSVWYGWNLAAFTINIIFVIISLYGLSRCYKYWRRGEAPPY